MNNRLQGFYRRTDGLAGIDKVPTEIADYSLDWAEELREGQTIQGATWTVPAGLVSGAEGVTGTIATKRIGGGVVGTEYLVDCLMVKNNGEQVPRTFVVSVVQRLS